MNIQTEHLDDHTARITVDIAPERLQQAKVRAAQQFSRRANIPGFRKGKAPYSIVLRYYGDAALVSDAIDLLTQEVYREALQASGADPYGPGSLVDVALEPQPRMIFSVPLQPVVTLGDYRSVRLDYAAPEVDDKRVNRSLQQLQQQFALVEESARPAQLGDRVTLDVHSHSVSETADDAAAGEEAHDHEHDDEHEHDAEDSFIHDHDGHFYLTSELEPVPGFGEALVGAVPGDIREFDLRVPDDAEEYDDFAGKLVRFNVGVKKVENVTLPELNDELAARATADEEQPLTLLELRMRVRENIQRSLQQEYDSAYAQNALDLMREASTIRYSREMLIDEADAMVNQFGENLTQSGLTLEDYLKLRKMSRETLREEFQPLAELRLCRNLVLRELISAEDIGLSADDIAGETTRMLASFSEEQQPVLRQLLESEQMQFKIASEVMLSKASKLVVAIARGEAPPLAAPAEAAEPAANPDSEEGEAS